MQALLDGRDVLAVMPTGSGKSAIYQVPAVLRAGPTVVVSPLLALQHDQAQSLAATGELAVQVNGSVPRADHADALEDASTGAAEFVFVTPEQLADEQVLAALADGRPSLVAVDEAHCVSSWGHDFRPDYLQVGRAVERLGRPPVVALTATAAPPVRDDIVARLGLRDPLLVVHGLDRPTIELQVRTVRDERTRDQAIVEAMNTLPTPALVYTATRKATEHLAALLDDGVRRVAAYHGGLAARRRTQVQQAFMADDLDVVVATNAFGMGVDKPDVRVVLHAATPDSPDSYWQEVGRAGRDGEPAWALLLHRPEDLSLHRFLSGGLPALETLAAVATAVHEHPGSSRSAVQKRSGTGRTSLGRALALLEHVGAVRVDARGRLLPGDMAPAEAARAAREEAERYQRVIRSRLEMMREYVGTSACRRQFVLGYFGEHLAQPCGSCDTCRRGSGAAAPSVHQPSGLRLQARVRHTQWDEGLVTGLSDGTVTVFFDSVGYRTLSLDLVTDRGLLEVEDDAALAG
jgi:ATP-dependent DNA helicase RecQ